MFLLNQSYWQIRHVPMTGRGVFAQKGIEAGRVIGDYRGTVLRTEEYDLASDAHGLYLMYLTDELSIYPDLTRDDIHLLNHSCAPNCWMYIHEGHTLFFAIRDIEPGEQLTIHYLLSPKEDGCLDCTHRCHCGEGTCTGTMHLSPLSYQLWQRFQDTHTSRLTKTPIVGQVLPALSHYPKILTIDPIYGKIIGQHQEGVSRE